MQLSKTRSELYQKQAGKNIVTWDEIRRNRQKMYWSQFKQRSFKKVMQQPTANGCHQQHGLSQLNIKILYIYK